jgi:hypothetical protein
MAGISWMVSNAWNQSGHAFAAYNIGDVVTIRSSFVTLTTRNVEIINIDKDGSYFVKEVFEDIAIVPKCFKTSGWSIIRQVVSVPQEPSEGVVLNEFTPLRRRL